MKRIPDVAVMRKAIAELTREELEVYVLAAGYMLSKFSIAVGVAALATNAPEDWVEIGMQGLVISTKVVQRVKELCAEQN